MSAKHVSVGSWRYCKPREVNGRLEIIVRLCFGPLENDVWGIQDGKYFHESKVVEGVEDCFFKYVSEDEFQKELDWEISRCRECGGVEIAEKLEKFRKT